MTYTVKKGDTLYGISNQFGVSVKELADLNNVTASTLQVGMKLTIPSTSGTNPDNMFIYTVKKGDSLYQIAKVYNTTVNDIVKLNNLKTTSLSIGQKLRIPETYSTTEKAPEYINYKVVKGDTLYSIAKKYNTNVDTIIKDNALKNNSLSLGMNLKIRIPESMGIVEECYGEEYVPVNNTYIVKKGDTLYSIAKKYNLTVDELKKKNNLTTNSLSVGMTLKV